MKQLAVLFFIISMISVQVNAETSVDRTITAEDNPEIQIFNRAGKVTVKGWNRKEIRIKGTLGKHVERLTVSQEDRLIVIKPLIKKKSLADHQVKCELTIMVPVDSDLGIKTVSSDLRLFDVNSVIKCETVSGSLWVDTAAARLTVKSVNGSIDIKGTAVEFSAETTSGSVEVTGNFPDGLITSVSGNIEYQGLMAARITLKSLSGDILLKCSKLEDSLVHLNSTSGNIKIVLDEKSPAAFSLFSTNGTIDVGSPYQNRLTMEKGRIFIDSEGGSSEVFAESVSGNIRIKS